MAEKIPVTVSELLATAGQKIASIARHREVMAQVAAQAKATTPAQPPAEGGGA